MRILNFGSLNIDLCYRVDRFSVPGETIDSRSFTRTVGGKGLNQSVALARAGAKVYHAGLIGQDGDILLEFLRQSAVNTDGIRKVDVPSGNAVIQIDSRGQNSIVLYGGANRSVTEEHITSVLSDCKAGDFLLLQNEINRVDVLMRKAHAKGMKIILNPSPFAGVPALPLHTVDFFIMNEYEAAQLAEKEEQEEIVTQLLARYPHAEFVMTLGENGSLYFSGTTRYHQPVVSVSAVDTTGAGDTFTGFFIASLADDKPIPAAMEIAAKAAAVAVTRKGAALSIPFMHEIR